MYIISIYFLRKQETQLIILGGLLNMVAPKKKSIKKKIAPEVVPEEVVKEEVIEPEVESVSEEVVKEEAIEPETESTSEFISELEIKDDVQVELTQSIPIDKNQELIKDLRTKLESGVITDGEAAELYRLLK